MTDAAISRAGNQHAAASRVIKVMFIVDELCRLGGAERVLLNMIRLLPRDRFSPCLVSFRVDPSLSIFENLPCAFHFLPLRRTWDISAVRVAWSLNQLIRRERIDIVHTFFETSDLWGGTIARLSGAGVLISSRRDMGILRSAKHRIAYRAVSGLYDQIQTVSEQVRGYCISQDKAPPGKVVTIYNGVSVSNTSPGGRGAALRIIPELSNASHVIATVAHIREVKGIDVLLRAAAQVRRHFPDVAFVVLGDNHQPGYFNELMQLRRDLGLEHSFHCPGAVERVSDVLNASHVFVLPSRSEGLSNAMLEAMACGLPCVATDVGGNREVIQDEVNGFLIPSDDPDSMSGRIITLLQDPVLAKRMGASGRALVQRQFTTEVMMTKLVRSYERLLDERSAQQR